MSALFVRRAFLALLLASAALAAGDFQGGSVQEPSSDRSRFAEIPLFVDPQGEELAAYELEVRASGAVLRLVGVEGGEHGSFAEAPFYDRGARLEERIVIGAYSTLADLPRARTLVARIHVQISGAAEPALEVLVRAAATRGGRKIPVQAACR